VAAAVRYDECWYSEAQAAEVAALAASTWHLTGAAVEIGAWQGRSTTGIARAIEPDVLHVVDHWQGDESTRAASPGSEARDNYGIFMDNMAEATAGNFRVWKMDWHDFVKWWRAPVRFLHLDADHSAEAVADCLRALLPRAVPGAIFAGDDWPWPSVREGVLQVFPEPAVRQGVDALWWTVIEE
jgi:hypothetical protein